MNRLSPLFFLVMLGTSLLAQSVDSNAVREESYALITLTKYCAENSTEIVYNVDSRYVKTDSKCSKCTLTDTITDTDSCRVFFFMRSKKRTQGTVRLITRIYS